MKKIGCLVFLPLLVSCTTVREFTEHHPVATAFIAGSLVASAAIALDRDRSREPAPGIVTLPAGPDCAAKPESCR